MPDSIAHSGSFFKRVPLEALEVKTKPQGRQLIDSFDENKT